MRYCADTWYILGLFHKEKGHLEIIQKLDYNKDHLLIPMVVYAEATKKLWQKGIGDDIIAEFWEGIELSTKIQLIDITKDIGKEAAKVSLTFSVPMIDSLVAATAKVMGCDVLLANDSDYNLLKKKKYLQIFSC